ncbi:MAG: Mini-ribonuclease 3 [Clostridia bacterium]|nr:Mini-ribonuclease 3 [Clostridia bacterium]
MEVAVNTEQVSPLALAYVGDAVYELFVRHYLIKKGVTKVNDLHREAVIFVRATTQAKIIHELEQELTEVERKIVKKGRNAKSGQIPKNTGTIEYRYSTGFESLLGYLYLAGQQERLEEILNRIPELVDKYQGKTVARSEI